MTEERTNLNVLMVEPGKAPYETQIGSDLQSMQALVGGYIQAVYPYEEPVALIANESGKLDGLPLNRALRDADGDIYDIVAGSFFIVGLGESDFTDLPHDLAEQFAEQFRQPEMYRLKRTLQHKFQIRNTCQRDGLYFGLYSLL